MKLKTIFLLSISAILTSCIGQSPAKERKSTGTQGDTVTQIADSILIVFQDKNNTYWFGSNGRGVYRYDGKSLVNFTTKHGLSSNQIAEIKEDKAGNIYICAANRVNKYDGKTITQLNPLARNADWKLAPGDLWFKNGSDEGFPLRYDGKALHQLKFPKNDKEDVYHTMYPTTPLSPYAIYTVYNDSKGRVWFGTGTIGVGCYDGKTVTWITEDDLTELHNGPANGIRSIQEDKDGTFWFGNTYYRYSISQNPTGGITYNRNKGIDLPKSYGIDGFEYMSAALDNAGNLWLATFANGVWCYDGKNITRYAIKNGDRDVTLYSIYKDNQGSLWLGTHTAGVYKFNGKEFEKVRF